MSGFTEMQSILGARISVCNRKLRDHPDLEPVAVKRINEDVAIYKLALNQLRQLSCDHALQTAVVVDGQIASQRCDCCGMVTIKPTFEVEAA